MNEGRKEGMNEGMKEYSVKSNRKTRKTKRFA